MPSFGCEASWCDLTMRTTLCPMPYPGTWTPPTHTSQTPIKYSAIPTKVTPLFVQTGAEAEALALLRAIDAAFSRLRVRVCGSEAENVMLYRSLMWFGA